MTRTYEGTHPWITFHLNTECLDHRTWMLLGEAESKSNHVAGVPMRPQSARQFYEVYLSKGLHGTTSIEGNTLSEDEVLARVRGQLELPESREYLGVEVDNVLKACNEIQADVIAGRPLELTPERVMQFNKMVLTGMDVPDDVVPGEIRTHSVGVLSYRGAPAEDCEYLLKEMCRWLGDWESPDTEMTFTIAVLKAIMAHLYIAWIHPFGDGNGRTARLIEFQLLVQAGVPIPAAHLLSDHYNRTREHYYKELDATSREPFPVERFIRYAMQGFVDELRQQLQVIRLEQMSVTWENYVHEHFRDQPSPARTRQKHIVLDLPLDEPVKPSRLPMLTPRLAGAYAGKGAKTITRDVNALSKMGLIRRVPGGITANREVIRAFLPVRAEQIG